MNESLVCRNLQSLTPGRIDRKKLPALLSILDVRWPKNKRVAYLNTNLTMLWELFERAEQSYKRLIKRFHSDIHGGSDRMAAILNVAWKRLKMLFDRRGVSRS